RCQPRRIDQLRLCIAEQWGEKALNGQVRWTFHKTCAQATGTGSAQLSRHVAQRRQLDVASHDAAAHDEVNPARLAVAAGGGDDEADALVAELVMDAAGPDMMAGLACPGTQIALVQSPTRHIELVAFVDELHGTRQVGQAERLEVEHGLEAGEPGGEV